jgi:hypothetical protein
MARKTFRDRLRARLDKRLNRAVKLGAMTEAEASEIREEVKSVNIILIIQIIMMIAEVIKKFIEEREAASA